MIRRIIDERDLVLFENIKYSSPRIVKNAISSHGRIKLCFQLFNTFEIVNICRADQTLNKNEDGVST